MASGAEHLRHTVQSGLFYSRAEVDILRELAQAFPEELQRLKRAYVVPAYHATTPNKPSPSWILYGEEYGEVNRTLTGALALRWIHNGDYETFVGAQPSAVRLKHDSFEWLRQRFKDRLITSDDLYALLVSIIINDLGKDPQLALDYETRTGHNIARLNHDLIILKAVDAGLVPCLDHLSAKHRSEIIAGLKLGATFNFGQLAQAENVPACLSGLLDLRSSQDGVSSLETRFLEQVLDIAGAAGHIDSTCAKMMTQPIFQAYRDVRDVSLEVVLGHLNPREAYDVILQRRARTIHDHGFRLVNIHVPEERALMRIFCMAGATELETVQLYEKAFLSLDDLTRSSLVHNLNIDGHIGNVAVLPTYMPAMLSRGAANTPSGKTHEKQKAITSLLQYLARLLAVTKQPEGPVAVIERNVRGILQDVVVGQSFKENPAILEELPLPKDEIWPTREDIERT